MFWRKKHQPEEPRPYVVIETTYGPYEYEQEVEVVMLEDSPTNQAYIEKDGKIVGLLTGVYAWYLERDVH